MDEGLRREDLPEEPSQQLARWLDEARDFGVKEPSAMVLATCSLEGKPSVRNVLLKQLSIEGLVFYTDGRSRKASELTENPRAAICFSWLPMERQVMVEGSVEPLPSEMADDYFAGRPRESQISSWSSRQGQVLESRQQLEIQVNEIEQRFKERDIPRPAHWVGFRLQPSRMEFWQQGLHRRHDRFHYVRQEEAWLIERLSP